MVCPTGKVKRQVKAYSRCQKAAPTKRMKAARKRVGKAAAKGAIKRTVRRAVNRQLSKKAGRKVVGRRKKRFARKTVARSTNY